MLRKPEPLVSHLGYGKMHPETMMGLRNAPPIHGVGLLEMIPQDKIDQLVDEEDKDKDGISGRLNQVWDFEAKKNRARTFWLKSQ